MWIADSSRRAPGNVWRVSEDAQDNVIARFSEGVGELTLNRPRAINALDIGMIRALSAALENWTSRADVRVVILDGAGERGFCAGGDVRGIREAVLAGEASVAEGFFREEYALDAAIAEAKVPVVVFADGITMGGGIGLAGHASHRLVTERSRLAMPETRIGFTPDVGGTWLLARAPGRLGEYLGLTGASMTGADAVYAGFADTLVPSAALPSIRAAIVDGVSPDEAIAPHAVTEPAPLAEELAWIDAAFSAATVPEIIARLRERAEPAARAAADTLAELSPTSLAVTLAAVRAARSLPDLRAVLAQEYGLACWFIRTQPDLGEGIRAQLVDKDRDPRWNPATPDKVPDGLGADALAYVPATPLWT